MKELIAKRYVKALIDVLDEKEIEAAAEKLESLSEAFNEKKFNEIIISPEVKKEEREAFILDIIGESDQKFINFIKILGIHNRFSLIPEVANLVKKELQRRSNCYDGVVESMNEIEKRDLEELEKALSKYVDATVVLHPVKSDYNGIKVVVEDLGIEATYSKDRIASGIIDHILKAL